MQTAIVTGSSGNLGQAVARKFLSEGFVVHGTLVPNDPVAIDISHDRFFTSAVDLTNEADSESFVASVIDRHGEIDVAVLTVGGFAMGNIEETSASEVFKQLRLNFETAYNTARPVFRQMRKQNRGRIFMIGSRPGSDMRQSKGMVAYGLSKSLVFRFAELMNEEAKGTDLAVSVIVPSTIDTPQNRESMPDADYSKWARPEDIASIIHFYCSGAGLIIREPVVKVYNRS